MRFKRLSIHNIASIADAEIDFDSPQLSDGAVFLICGETGSGKTMILDAVCLALFNNTPRLGHASRSESYLDQSGTSITLTNPVQYVRKGAWEASIELLFDIRDKEYKASWSTYRANRKTDGRFQGITWELTDISSGEVSKGSRIQELTGLDFEEFRRTVMLAQGDFTAFLKSREDEKSVILEKITGTGIYRKIGKRIADRYKDISSRCLLLQNSIENLSKSILDEEQVRETESRITADKEAAKRKGKEATALSRAVTAFEQMEKARKEALEHSAILDKGKEEFARLCGGIGFAADDLRSRMERLEKCKEYLEEEKENSKMYLSFPLIEKDLSIMESGQHRLDGLKKQLEDIEGEITKLKALNSEYIRSAAEKEAAYKVIEENLKAEQARRNALNPDTLLFRKEGINTLRSLEETIKTHTDTCEDIKKEMAAILDLGISSEKECKKAEASWKETKELYDRMRECNSQWAKDARAGLRVGDDCPVCGQRIADEEYLESISDSHFESLLSPVRSLLAEKEETYNKAHSRSMQIRLQQQNLSQQLSKAGESLKKAEESINEAYARYGDLSHSDADLKETDAAIAQAEAISKSIESMTSLLGKAQKEVIAARSLMAGTQERLSAENARKDSCIKARQETEEDMERCMAELEGLVCWKGWYEEWKNDSVGFISRLKEASAAYSAKTEETAALESDIARINEVLEEICRIREKTALLLPGAEDIEEGEHIRIRNLLQLWNTLSNTVGISVSAAAAAKKRIAECSEIVSEYGNGTDCESAKERLKILNEEISSLNQSIGSAERLLEINGENRKKHAGILQEYAQTSLQRDRWKALNDTFGKKDGEYFQKIAQGFIMNDILSKANHYLKTMTGRYVLESQSGSLNIMVRDMDQGGVLRSTSTISGGESFVISLALALGLSSLGSGRISSGILFIDEGFGTLSGDYLDTVIETLQRLHENGGKRVGIISHVKELRERIPSQIRVCRTDPGTSIVEVVG